MILAAPYKPKECEVRIKRKFAFWPIPLPDGRRIWLQWYWIKLRYQSKAYSDDTSILAEMMKIGSDEPISCLNLRYYYPDWLRFGPYANIEDIPILPFDNNPNAANDPRSKL